MFASEKLLLIDNKQINLDLIKSIFLSTNKYIKIQTSTSLTAGIDFLKNNIDTEIVIIVADKFSPMPEIIKELQKTVPSISIFIIFNELTCEQKMQCEIFKGIIFLHLESLDIKTVKLILDNLRQKKHDNFKSIISNSTDGVIILSQDKTIKYLNKAATFLLNIDEQKLLNHKFPFDIAYGQISEIKIKSDDEKFLRMKITDTAWDNKLTQMVILQDISKEKKLEANLMQAQKLEALGRIVGQVAHDFKNIVGAIESFLDMSENCSNKTIFDKSWQGIKKCALHAKSITEQMMDFSKKKQTINIKFDVSQFLQENKDIYKQIAGKSVELSYKIFKTPIFVNADPEVLNRIIINIIKNAKEAMNESGKIELELLVDKYAQISIKDNGPGIPKHHLDHLFEPFFTTKKGKNGTGFGLSSSYMSIKNMDGDLKVESKVNEGAKFIITLPMYAQGEKDESPTETTRETIDAY